jgi:AraC family transcriptional regulator
MSGLPHVGSGHFGRRLQQLDVAGAHVNRAVYRARSSTPPHVHPLGNLFVVLHGGLEQRWERRVTHCGPLDVVVKPPGTEHADRFGTRGLACLNLELEDAAWEEFAGRGARLQRPVVLRHPPLQRLGCALAGALRDPDAERLEAEELVCSLLAALSDGGARVDPRWLEQARDLVHEGFASRIHLDVVARAVGVHPVHLAKRFRERFGCSLGEHVRWLRVQAAVRALAERERSLADVAAEVGFSDQSHMGRAFRRELGSTPGACCAHLAGGSPFESF